MKKMKIAIVVPGRFHAFGLVLGLIENGEDVTLFTNYPKCVVKKWGIPTEKVRSFLLHGVVAKMINKLRCNTIQKMVEPFMNSWFSVWAGKKILKEQYDVVRVFSGVAEEIFRMVKDVNTVKILVRGSSHIETQHTLLSEETVRAERALEIPSQWIIEREKNEYELADNIQVLSSFALKSFLDKGIQRNKVDVFPLGVDTTKFRPDRKIIEKRVERMLSGKPLRVLIVGSFSFRKGILDLEKIVLALSENMHFTFVGDIPFEGKDIAKRIKENINMIPRQPEYKLVEFYNSADVFIFPTIEDGFAVVLSQALAAGLPIICTTNCCGPDLLNNGANGWVVPIRKPGLFIEQLKWCENSRKDLADMVRNIHESDSKQRTWNDAAMDFVNICHKLAEKKESL